MTVSKNSYRNRFRIMEDLPTGGTQPSLCVAYLLLTGTSGWAIKQSSSLNTSYALGAFSFLLGHSLVGFLHTTHPDPGDIVKKIFKQTVILSEVIPITFINAEFYLLSGFSSEYAYAHLATALLPTVTQFIEEDHIRTVIDVVILGNIASMLYIQIVKETGVWTGGMIALSALNHFMFKKLSSRYEVPKIEIVTIGLTFFNVFAINCIRHWKN